MSPAVHRVERMPSVRQRVIHRYPLREGDRTPDEQLADALYSLLWSLDAGPDVDGWTSFHVMRESPEALDAVGLMSLLPSGTVPIAIRAWEQVDGFGWSVRVGCVDDSWLALSESKQWNIVYSHATGVAESPAWTWGAEHQGSVQDAMLEEHESSPAASDSDQ